MEGSLVYSRTPKGDEEVQTRKYGVSMAVRRILILVDGKSSVDRLTQTAQGIGDIASGLAELEVGGFIQRSAASGPSPAGNGNMAAVKQALIAAANEVLGKDAGKIVEKVRQAPEDREGLLSSLQNCKKVVRLTISEKKAKILEEKCQEIIGQL